MSVAWRGPKAVATTEDGVTVVTRVTMYYRRLPLWQRVLMPWRWNEYRYEVEAR